MMKNARRNDQIEVTLQSTSFLDWQQVQFEIFHLVFVFEKLVMIQR
jgi:hypothetical protein